MSKMPRTHGIRFTPCSSCAQVLPANLNGETQILLKFRNPRWANAMSERKIWVELLQCMGCPTKAFAVGRDSDGAVRFTGPRKCCGRWTVLHGAYADAEELVNCVECEAVLYE